MAEVHLSDRAWVAGVTVTDGITSVRVRAEKVLTSADPVTVGVMLRFVMFRRTRAGGGSVVLGASVPLGPAVAFGPHVALGASVVGFPV